MSLLKLRISPGALGDSHRKPLIYRLFSEIAPVGVARCLASVAVGPTQPDATHGSEPQPAPALNRPLGRMPLWLKIALLLGLLLLCTGLRSQSDRWLGTEAVSTRCTAPPAWLSASLLLAPLCEGPRVQGAAQVIAFREGLGADRPNPKGGSLVARLQR